jgi:hypothetical protein
MTPHTKDYTLVHEEQSIVHGDLTGVGLVYMYNIRLNLMNR